MREVMFLKKDIKVTDIFFFCCFSRPAFLYEINNKEQKDKRRCLMKRLSEEFRTWTHEGGRGDESGISNPPPTNMMLQLRPLDLWVHANVFRSGQLRP
jgi:hypothetical protein